MPDPEVIEGEAAPETEAAAPPSPPELPQPEAQPEDPHRKQVAKLSGRVGGLVRTLNESREREAAQAKELEVLRGMLNQDGNVTVPAKPMAQSLSAEDRAAIVAQVKFDEDCNRIYDEGMAAGGEEFKSAIANLGALGFMTPAMIDAALATDAASRVLQHLGQDLDEAERLAKLSPARMGAELAKIAAKLSPLREHSNAPPPIKPLGGSHKAEPDIYDPDLSDEDYRAARAKQGAFWAPAYKPA